MLQRVRQIAAIVFLGLSCGCAYERGAGCHWDAGAVGDGVIDSFFSLIPDNRSTAERMEDDSNEFFNR